MCVLPACCPTLVLLFVETLFLNAAGAVIPNMYAFAQGLIGLQNLADVNSSMYQYYASSWAAQPAEADLPSVVPSDPSSIQVPANFAYDIVWFFAHALDRMIRDYGVDLSGGISGASTADQRALFLAVLKNVSFAGVSGPVSVDQLGDRFAPFDILNVQGGRLVNLGSVTAAGVVTYQPGAEFLFMGGSKAFDHVVRGVVSISEPIRHGLIAVTLLCLLMVAVAAVVLHALRKESIFKAASPPFVGAMLLGVALLLSSVFPRAFENFNKGTVGTCLADLFLTNCQAQHKGQNTSTSTSTQRNRTSTSAAGLGWAGCRVPAVFFFSSLTLLLVLWLLFAVMCCVVLSDGYTLIAGSLLLKTVRVERIFLSRRFQQRVLTNGHLAAGLLLLLLLQTALLLGLTQSLPMRMQLASYDTTNDYYYCSADQFDTVYVAVIMVFRFALLAVTAIYSYRIRDIPDNFSQNHNHTLATHSQQQQQQQRLGHTNRA